MGWLALLATLASGAALYAASPNARHWRGRRPAVAAAIGWLLAAGGLAAWIAALGAAAGTCAMLACWMLALALMPWLALVRNEASGMSGSP